MLATNYIVLCMVISRDIQIIYGFRNDYHMLGIFTVVNKYHDLTLRILLEDTFYLKHPGLNRQFIYHKKSSVLFC